MRPEYAQRYRELWRRHWWWRSRERHLLGWVSRLSGGSGGRKILDVGCGDGLFFDRLARFGTVQGVEPDASLLVDPRWRSRIRVEAFGESFRPRAEYDLVLMLDVLEHIADDLGALEAALGALRPGGHLLLTVPALRWLWSGHDEANAHFRRYEPAELERVLERAGFEIETVRFFFAWTVVPLVCRRWLVPAGTGSADYDVAIPPAPLNAALTLLSGCEHALGRFVRWPLGSSLLAVARRPAGGRVADSPARGELQELCR